MSIPVWSARCHPLVEYLALQTGHGPKRGLGHLLCQVSEATAEPMLKMLSEAKFKMKKIEDLEVPLSSFP